MHWAAHGHTAAEVIYKRIDANKPNLGMTNFKGDKPNKSESQIAKNFLTEEEINILNRVVTAYLEIAELQALNQKPMYMKDWITRLDDFLRMTGNEILENAGSISHNQMLEKAGMEFKKYKENTLDNISRVEEDFIEYILKTTKTIANNI